MMDELWQRWQADWRWMEEIARRRGWNLTPLSISPPASEGALRRIEDAIGMAMPMQLRQVLAQYSANVEFEWHIPSHLHPMEQRQFPTSSLNRGAIWDIDQIESRAIPNFLGWKRDLATVEEAEAPNTPEMWERQFPFYELINGDMLTIDMRAADGPHPVRYFSHELAVLHGQALAPDFFTFITEMAKLGQAGTEWASWARFGTWDEDRCYLSADSAGGREWRQWLESDPAAVTSDEPPPVILGETDSERTLLEAAQSGDTAAALAAMTAGARPDVVWNPNWPLEYPSYNDEFPTALTYAIRQNNIVLAERLVAMGAGLNTRRLAVAEAISNGSLSTLEWLIANGGRVNGWESERYWPLHLLITRRSRFVAASREQLEKRLREENKGFWDGEGMDSEIRAILAEQTEKTIASDLAAYISREDYLAMLEKLLHAGADPDARWDNGTTMLMWADPDVARILIRHGADPNARTPGGQTPLHYTSSADTARVLVDAGADIDALASPDGRKSETDPVYTPLQSSLMLGDLRGIKLPRTLLELGADPAKRDGEGFPTLAYATSVSSFKLMEPYGLDPLERMPDGGTLLHRLYRQRGAIRAAFPNEVAILDLLLSQGIDINAVDNTGQTVLHVAAPDAIDAASIELLLVRGSDSSIRDHAGKLAIDRVPRSKKDLRAALK